MDGAVISGFLVHSGHCSCCVHTIMTLGGDLFQCISSNFASASSSSSSSSSSVTTETVQQPSIMTHHVLVVLEEMLQSCFGFASLTKRSQSVNQSVSHISSKRKSPCFSNV
jgi:hypothetical protein